MLVIHVVRDLDVASGGPSRSVPALAEHESTQEGVTVVVLFRDRGKPKIAVNKSAVEYRALTRRDFLPGQFLKAVAPLSAGKCIVHLHGLWSPTVHRAARLAQKHKVPYVVSTKGMLADWAIGHKALKKRIAWWLYQERDLAGAAALLASSELEQQDVAVRLPRSKIVTIPHGLDKRPHGIQVHAILSENREIRWALAMGRLHPVKGYAELIEAWGMLQPPGWKLAIAGPDEDRYRAVLEALIRKYALTDQVVLLGEVDDKQKWALLDQSELFIAPSKTENFGMAIAEALQSGTPVITTTGTPWRELIEYDCGWWVKPDGAELSRAIKEATGASAAELRRKGENGRNLITEKYSWDQVAAKTIELYRSILSSPRPDVSLPQSPTSSPRPPISSPRPPISSPRP